MRFFWQKSRKLWSLGKIRKYDEEVVFFWRKKRFHRLKLHLYQIGKAQNVSVETGCLISIYIPATSAGMSKKNAIDGFLSCCFLCASHVSTTSFGTGTMNGRMPIRNNCLTENCYKRTGEDWFWFFYREKTMGSNPNQQIKIIVQKLENKGKIIRTMKTAIYYIKHQK